MTKRLDPMHPQDALYASVRQYRTGVKGFAHDRGVAAEYMYQKLDKGNPKGHIEFGDELFDMLLQLKADGVPHWNATLEALAHLFGGLYVQLPEVAADGSNSECAGQMVQAIKEFSEFSTELAKDAQDGGIDDAELASIKKEANDALIAIQSLVVWAEQINAKGKPSSLRRAA